MKPKKKLNRTYTYSDLHTLTEALNEFSQASKAWEKAYLLLQEKVAELDRELKEKNQQLATTTEYLTNLLESISDGVIAIDLNGKISIFNRSAQQILGYSLEEVVGKHFEKVFGRTFLPNTRSLKPNKLKAKSGRMIPIAEKNSNIVNTEGTPIGIVKVFQDLTEILELKSSIQQKETLALIGEMSATVAHEIRNPLGGIRGFASLLAKDIPTTDTKYKYVEKIIQGIQTLEKIVNDLLEYTRPLEIHYNQINLFKTIQESIEILNPDKRRISIDIKCPKTIEILGDENKLKQVLRNIFTNSIQSIKNKGKITTSVENENNFVKIEIKDTGCGIKEDVLPKIFSPFFTTKEKGTGLGLAISQKIIGAHGGQIKAESKYGKGTKITIWLPIE
ncbi:MAG: ATP-binding protein [Candidatus Hydrogenedentes bacterium]|nr:ATP-binding protein [Candidatus Hydrogenedentota bacterium]